jgi:outer membrane protein TolC
MGKPSVTWLAAIALLGATTGVAPAQEAAPMTLPEAVAWAVDHNPKLAAATARIERAQAKVLAARAPAQPVFKLSGSGRLQNPVQQITIPGPDARTVNITRSDFATVSLGVVWPLWGGGRVEAATGAARAQVDAAEADLQQATEQLIYEVGIAYFRAQSSRSALVEAQAGLTDAEEGLRTARVRHEAGTVTLADVTQAEAVHRRAEQLVATAHNAAIDADQAFNALLARPLGETVALAEAAVDFECPAEPADAQAVALAVRPELLALSSRQEAARHAIAQARAERKPGVAVGAEVAWQTPSDVMPSHTEYIGLGFSWPILSHPASRASERQARATVEELGSLRRDLERAIALQVSESGRRLADAGEAIAAADEALRAATDGARQAEAAYGAGTITRQQLTAAQSALSQAREKRAQAGFALSAAKFSRARALGLLRSLVLIPAQEVTGQ